MQLAKRLEKIPPYLFTEINRKQNELIERGVEVINFGVGDPDQPTFNHVVQAMHEAIQDSTNHHYSPNKGLKEYRQAAADWMKRRFGVEDLNPETEIISSIGSKESIHNIFLAFVNPGDYTIIPDPGYPVYRTSTIFAEGQPYSVQLRAENGFLPILSSIPQEVAEKAKLLWVNYPNNPTGATASLEFFQELVDFCRHYNILLCHDNAYSEIAYDNYKSPSILQIPNAKDIAIEFHSLSKTYNMTGWRIGFVVGNSLGIKGLSQVKSNIDSGVFKAIQKAAIAAFSTTEKDLQNVVAVYQKRRDILIKGLQSLGYPIKPNLASLYIWVPIPKNYTSQEFATLLLEKCSIIVLPGKGYGASGEGFIRIALTVEEKSIYQALQRMKNAGINYIKP
ncbi:MAG: LL-diaminopimelate aminotransferase [Trichodesmium sp. MAG_R04]|nr:LL-diaminopimelate aminotransferase [Trichodesmium sp. MAG_R04]